ncbi:MAG TPA: FecR family protein [Planctomicrobium sp.]|nr:FecR family protein [Planctomicrobium sp.]
MNRWEDLLNDYMDGLHVPESHDELDRWLAEDPDHARQYAIRMLLHCELLRCRWSIESPRNEAIHQRTFWWSLFDLKKARYGVVTVIALTIFPLLAWFLWDQERFLAEAPPDVKQKEMEQIAVEKSRVSLQEIRVPAGRISQSVNVQWPLTEQRWSVGDILNEKDVIHLVSGRMEVQFNSGALMTLVGPAVLEIRSAYLVQLQSGIATTRAENLKSGLFRIMTPWTEVVDLGTEFGVRVDPKNEEADVVVFEGAVGLVPIDQSSEEFTPSRILQKGEAVRVSKHGRMERVVSIENSAYPIGDNILSPSLKRDAVITRVTDDRRDPSSPKYYRIYHAALDEDSRAYVDRTHEWNGITEEGIPYYLRGADYVAGFNDDKMNCPEVTIELSRPAMLYLLLDDRYPPPDWLTKSFEKLDEKIGLDQGPSNFHQSYQTGHGPGVSIDTIHSIWRRRVESPGTVTIGALPRATIELDGKTFKESTSWSMYGIVAQPLE